MEPPATRVKLSPEDIAALRNQVRSKQIGVPIAAKPSDAPLTYEERPPETAYGTGMEPLST